MKLKILDYQINCYGLSVFAQSLNNEIYVRHIESLPAMRFKHFESTLTDATLQGFLVAKEPDWKLNYILDRRQMYYLKALKERLDKGIFITLKEVA